MTQSKKKQQVRISEIIISKYRGIFNNTKIKHIILTSGRAGTKSSYAAIRADYQILADPYGSVVVLRKHHNKLRKTVYKEMLRGLNRLKVKKTAFKITKSPMEITYKKHGTTIYFSGSDGIDDTKGIIDEDKPIKLVILDELTEFFDDGEGEDELTNIEATFVRGNSSGFQMIYLYNPPKNPNAEINQWCKKMEKRGDCIHIHTTYEDVPIAWLGQDLIDSAEEMKKTDLKMYRWVWLGESTGVDDLIYYMFKPEHHTYNPDDYSKKSKEAIGEIGIGVDYGQQNATVFEAAGIDYENQILRGLKEYYHSGRETGKQKSPSDYAKDLKQFCDEIEKEYNRVVSYIFIDPSAAGLIEEARRQLPHISIISARNDVKLGISRVQKFLSFKRLLLSTTQKHLIKEMGIYQYEPKSIEKGKEEPLKVSDHAEDALRYLLVGMWKQIFYMLPMAERGDEN
ncbi:PBSX family phage terminase large subunit [Lachnospiraceae bacterium WCA-9-b2]|uniref:PBSX family phage terminase large subunit n=1 Tax=Sporofaciens musculi TaxID=2681861 RepID=A0A7X3SK90_9FIRM|nr:PBSX family phage terminase large subunit [Sporofaciens musculi]MXP77244.1 PBSX family phage terminase large subunit [Sporofaciens musculi]